MTQTFKTGKRSFTDLFLVSLALMTSLVPSLASQGDAPTFSLSGHWESVQRDKTVQWLNSPFGCLTTELWPGVLITSQSRSFLLFHGMDRWGLAPPTGLAYQSPFGIRIRSRPCEIRDPLSAPWIVCWFAGAKGWKHDVPVLIVLQRRPSSLSLTQSGLEIRFPDFAGLVVILPLFGYFKCPTDPSTDYLKAHNMPSKNLYTSRWFTGIPRTVVSRCEELRQWARAIPVGYKEDIRVDGDAVIIRHRFTFLEITDEWGSAARRYAPIPPTLGLSLWSSRQGLARPFPVSVSGRIVDPDYPTVYGPYCIIPDADSVTYHFPVMPYIREGEVAENGSAMDPLIRPIWNRLVERLAAKFQSDRWDQIWDHGGPENYCWQVMGDRWYARALPLLPENVRNRVRTSLLGYLDRFILDPKNYRPFLGMLLLVGPGIGTWGGFDDAGKFSSNLLETVWSISFYSDEWSPVKSHWQTVRRFFITPLESDWKSVGRYAIAELGDEAPPALAMARLSYGVGDKEAFVLASATFARELVHHYVKQVGHHFFRLVQPWHSEEFIPEDVFLTNLWGDLAGWQMDGPTYPKITGERQFRNRWVRFSSPEVGLFYRQYLFSQVKKEMDQLTAEATGNPQAVYPLLRDTAHIAPSVIRLRALLLKEPTRSLLKMAPFENWQLDRVSDITALSVALLENGLKRKKVIFFPPINTPFQLGIPSVRQRCEFPGLGLAVETVPVGEAGGLPFVRWWGWKAPAALEKAPGGQFWSFGFFGPSTNGSIKIKQRDWDWLNSSTRIGLWQASIR